MGVDFTRLNNLGKGQSSPERPQKAAQGEPARSQTAQAQRESDLFYQCWDLLRRFYNIRVDDEEAWRALIDRANEIDAQREGTERQEVARELVSSTVHYIVAVSKAHSKAREIQEGSRQQKGEEHGQD